MDAGTMWLMEWFERRGSVPGSSFEEKLATNYFKAGLIDSMAVIELISAVEEHFDLRFTENHFQDRRFATIGGLLQLIHEIHTCD